MDVFLPIAQVFVNPIEILLLSALVGVLSGLFGVGGGFLMTPFLIFLGVPPAYAVANEANNILATSVSGSTTHYLKNTLDYKMVAPKIFTSPSSTPRTNLPKNSPGISLFVCLIRTVM